jgi:hypothetical protein
LHLDSLEIGLDLLFRCLSFLAFASMCLSFCSTFAFGDSATKSIVVSVSFCCATRNVYREKASYRWHIIVGLLLVLLLTDPMLRFRFVSFDCGVRLWLSMASYQNKHNLRFAFGNSSIMNKLASLS